MSDTTVQITMTATNGGDLAKPRYVTVAFPRDALAAALAAAAGRSGAEAELRPRLVGK